MFKYVLYVCALGLTGALVLCLCNCIKTDP
nr:MAG TPA: hypothetical protein [Caudoviricetes sp.]